DALAAQGRPDLWLLAAGKQVEPLEPLLDTLPQAVRQRVRVRDGFVPEEEIEALFAAADAVVLPYRRILTSGAALLALSLRRPVVAPGFASLREVLEDGRDALLYDPADPSGLGEALRRFADLDDTSLERLQAGALATARRYDWRQ